MSHVWDNANASGGELLVLLALADHANDKGVCWPGVARVARKARMSERHVQRILRKLQRAGQLTMKAGAGNKGTNLYQIPMGGDKLSGVTFPTSGGDISGSQGVTQMSPEPSIEPSENRNDSSPASRSSHLQLHLVDEVHIQMLKGIFRPKDVDSAVAKCKGWLLTPKGKGKALTKKRLNTFLSDAEPLAAPGSTPRKQQQEPPPEFCERFLRENYPDASEELLTTPFSKLPESIRDYVAEAWRDRCRSVGGKPISQLKQETHAQAA